LWLLLSQRKNTIAYKADGTVADTGHEWDGLRELNNPLPSWWMWMFIFSIIFGVVYLYFYPGMGSYPGSLGFTTTKEHSESVLKANAELKPFYEKYSAMSIADICQRSSS
jgi:cytochrome c oxidase cbb3-type subunit 3